jgi:hypothetical protein
LVVTYGTPPLFRGGFFIEQIKNQGHRKPILVRVDVSTLKKLIFRQKLQGVFYTNDFIPHLA